MAILYPQTTDSQHHCRESESGNNPGMTRKPQSDSTFKFRCWKADIESFEKQAQAEGFDSVSTWLLWHLRKIVRDAAATPPTETRQRPKNSRRSGRAS